MPNQQITWEDAQPMPDDGLRYEAIGGELIVTPAPSLRHQDIVLELAVRLRAILVEPGHGHLWIAPVGVEFPATREGVQPDLVFVSNARRGIVSDLTLGVAQYWIVDPEADAVEVRRFGEEPGFERFTERMPVRLGESDVGEVDLEVVFRRE